MSLKISSRLVGDVVILDVSGRITLLDHGVLRDSVRSALDAGQKKILLNVAEVDYIDSSGLGELFSTFTRTRSQGGELKLLGLTKKVHDLLQITKLYTVMDVQDDENIAVESFRGPALRCCCPICGYASGPPIPGVGLVIWPPQLCRNARCEIKFTAVFSGSKDQARVNDVRIQTYKDEYLELLSGPPFTVKIVGRLDLFSSPALKKVWQGLPLPRRVMVDLSAATEIDEAGREALVDLLAKREKDAKAVVSLEGLGSKQVGQFPTEPPFYRNKATALAALGDVSDAPPLLVRVLKEDVGKTVEP
jgi:anti-sigma B factor antagonist